MSPLIYIIAGEPSGDLIGGRLMAALQHRTPVRFAGIGGESMAAQGLTSLFPMSDLSVMGLVEVLPRLPRILGRIRQTVADIERLRPDAVVTIDSWGFTGRVQRAIQTRLPHIPRIHAVAPMVWAWKPGRTKTLARVLDLLLCLLPFEPAWFTREGLAAIHVGHPVIENGADRGSGAAFRARHAIAPEAPLLVVLPGSRHSETARMLPVFGESVRLLAARHPGLTVVVPTVPGVAAEVRAAVAGWGLPVLVVEGSEKFDAFAAGTAAIAASGTVALELAMAGLPFLVAYKVSPLSAFVATRFLGLALQYACLVNIVMDAPVVPELLQHECRPDRLAEAAHRLIADPGVRAAQKGGAAEAMRRLGLGGESPGARAADAVLARIRGGQG